MRPGVLLVLVSALVVTACSDSEPSGLPDDVLGSIQISARVEPVDMGIAVLVTLSNTGNERATLSYPAGCPVRLQLFRTLDDQLVFDESDEPCDVHAAVTAAIEPGATRTLTSGLRAIRDILGDSLLAAPYNVVAILRIVGQNPIEVPAGLYNFSASGGVPSSGHR